jgi:hypothetical protein
MKKKKGHSEEITSKKRGKGSAESGESKIIRKDPNDLGDPRGSRAPGGNLPTDNKEEKGDVRRPFKNK